MEADRKDIRKKIKIPDFLTWNVLVLSVINILFVILIFWLLSRLGNLSNEHSAYRNKNMDTANASDINLLEFELANHQENIERLSKALPDETGLLEFIDQVERLKHEGTVVTISFTSIEPVKDKLGNLGVPILVNLSGPLQDVLRDLETLQELAFLFKPIRMDIGAARQISQDRNDAAINTSGVDVVYGGFLYVDDKFSKNR